MKPPQMIPHVRYNLSHARVLKLENQRACAMLAAMTHSSRVLKSILKSIRHTTLRRQYGHVAYQYLHCTTKLTLYLRTDIDIERHSVSVQSMFATCIVYKLHHEVGLVLIIHFM